MEAIESLLSTQKVDPRTQLSPRKTLTLLSFLSNSCVHPQLDRRTPTINQLLIMQKYKNKYLLDFLEGFLAVWLEL